MWWLPACVGGDGCTQLVPHAALVVQAQGRLAEVGLELVAWGTGLVLKQLDEAPAVGEPPAAAAPTFFWDAGRQGAAGRGGWAGGGG